MYIGFLWHTSISCARSFCSGIDETSWTVSPKKRKNRWQQYRSTFTSEDPSSSMRTRICNRRVQIIRLLCVSDCPSTYADNCQRFFQYMIRISCKSFQDVWIFSDSWSRHNFRVKVSERWMLSECVYELRKNQYMMSRHVWYYSILRIYFYIFTCL